MVHPQIGLLSAVMYARFRVRPGRISMPDVCCDLFWVEDRLWLAGPQSRATASRLTGQEVRLLNIEPLVARAWLGIPLRELTDIRIPLVEVDARRAGPLSELFHAGSAGSLVRPVAPQPPPASRALQFDAMLRQERPAGKIARAMGVSERQLERLAQDWFGLSPRQYANILRFRRAVHGAASGQRLGDAAAQAGYADQPHFNREVRALTRTTPRALLPNVGNVQDAVLSLRKY